MRVLFRRVLVVLFTLLVCSCAVFTGKPKVIHADRTRHYTLHVDSRFAEADRQSIVGAFATWEQNTHGIVTFSVAARKWDSKEDDMEFAVDDENGCTVDVYVADIDGEHSSIKEIEKNASRPGNTLGYTSRTCERKVVAFVMDRIKTYAEGDPKALEYVAVHEAGHLIGLDHIPVPDESVMFPSLDHAKKCATSLDMKQFCLMYGCDWHDMKTCD